MKGPFAIVLAVASGIVGASWVGAQDPDRQAEAPKLSLFPVGYLDHDALSDSLKRLARDYPEAVRLASLAKSREGREVWVVSVGREVKGTGARPSVLVVANLEADHAVGTQVALGLIERLAGDRDPAVARLLEGRTVHVVPRLNPDGAERLLKKSPRMDLRGNLAAIDRDRDGKAGEDGPNDLDGDGLALAMRARDARASLVPDAKDPRILRKADPAKGERAVFSESTEGIDDDADGAIDEDPPGGVNLNRNWPQGWTEYNPETGAYPASEPEVAGLIRFAFGHPEIAAVWSFGLNDNLRGEPRGFAAPEAPILAELILAFGAATAPRPEVPREEPRKDEPRKDEPRKEEAPKDEPARKAEATPVDAPRPKAQGKGGRAGSRASTPSAPAGSAPTPGIEGTTDGALSEWAYQQFGVVGLASRLWPRPEGVPGGPSPTGEGDARWLDWNDRVMGGSAFVPFRRFDHPTLGPVEIGGWKPGVRLNPPIEQVGAIVDGHYAFLKDLAGRLPSLSISSVKAEAKGGGVFEIKATIENAGTLPTALAQGLTTRKAPPVLVRLDLGGAKLLAGKALNRIDALAGSGGSREFRWLVLAPEGTRAMTLEATCPKAGSARREVALP